MKSTKINHYLMIFITYSVMLMFGFIENLKGMAIPPIRNEFHVDFAIIGTMVFFSSLGYLITCFLGGILSEKLGHKITISIGYLLLISSTLLIYSSPNIIVVNILMFTMFCGLGIFETSGNLLAGEVFTKNTAVMLNFMHLFYGLGSVIGPKFAGFYLISGHTWKQYYLYASFICIIFFIITLIIKFPKSSHHEKHHKISFKEIIADKKVWVLGIALGMAVVLELGTSNWFVNYLSEVYKMNADKSSFYMSLFYITFVFGRLFGGFIAEKIGYFKLIISFLVISLFLYSTSLILKEKGAILISLSGFFISVIFPTTIAIVLKRFTKDVGAVMSFVITMSALINMIFNWIIGKVNDLYGVYTGFLSFILYFIVTIVFFVLSAKMFESNNNLKGE